MVFNGIKCLPDIMAGTLLLSVTVFVFIIIIILTMVSEQVKGLKGEKKTEVSQQIQSNRTFSSSRMSVKVLSQVILKFKSSVWRTGLSLVVSKTLCHSSSFRAVNSPMGG